MTTTMIGILEGLLGFLQGLFVACVTIWCFVFTLFFVAYLVRGIRQMRELTVWIRRHRTRFYFDDGSRHSVMLKTVTIGKTNNEETSSNNDGASLSRLRE